MDQRINVRGYGHGPAGRAADWAEFDDRPPARGPQCPPTASLIALATDQLPPAEAEALRLHLWHCPACQVKADAQRRALAAPAPAFLEDPLLAALLDELGGDLVAPVPPREKGGVSEDTWVAGRGGDTVHQPPAAPIEDPGTLTVFGDQDTLGPGSWPPAAPVAPAARPRSSGRAHGYGHNAAGRAADWAEFEADRPARTPHCPTTADLIGLATGQVAPDEVAALHEHVQGCAYCQPRYEAQCRSLSRASAPPRAGDELIDALIAALEAITPEAEPMPAGVEGGEAADAEAATLTSFAGLETLGPGRQPLAPPAPAPAPKARSEVKRPG